MSCSPVRVAFFQARSSLVAATQEGLTFCSRSTAAIAWQRSVNVPATAGEGWNCSRTSLFLHSARITETFLAAAHGGRRCALQVRAVPNLLALPHGIVCCLWRVAWPGDPEREECATAFQLATSSVRPSLRCSASCRDQHYTSALVTVLLVTGGWAVSGVGATYFHDRRCLGWVQFCLSGRNYIRHLLCLFHVPYTRTS